MSISYADRVKETSTVSGLSTQFFLDGPVVAGAYRGFVDKIGNGRTVVVLIDHAEYSQWAVYAATIVQGTPDYLDCSLLLSSSNDDAQVNFQPGTKELSCILCGYDIDLISSTARGDISGGQYRYDAAFGYVLSAGYANVDGFRVSWPETNGAGPTGYTADTMYYFYLYDTAGPGDGGLEFDAIEPVFDPVRGYWIKTGDNTRRMIGALNTTAAGAIAEFFSSKTGNAIEYFFWYPLTDGIVFSGQTAAAWTELTALSSRVPVGASGWYPRIDLAFNNADVEVSMGLLPTLDAAHPIEEATAVLTDTSSRNSDVRRHTIGGMPCDPDDPRTFLMFTTTNTVDVVVIVRGWTLWM